ncbi:DUF1684 domain-containing protein [Nocardioides sp. BP30]|uniref:DUF1684 domain-containing protein n=1 Tax=Nocardioides sp. BP30 TaxID=3036374 RepID=UPI0024683FB8|nr:DUF1684 domain-containing protein [Nocardioides sp. BP30]WGL53283.1 DUF1684 domain-containing protein [Nocardioides sp. BP30]
MTIQETDAFTEEWQAWHRAKDERLASPHGFLAVTGLHWLTAQAQRWEDAPGAWSTGPEGVSVELADGESLVVDGVPVTGRHAFGVIPERGGVEAAFGDAVVEVAKRGGNDLIRPRHPDNPLRLSFAGTPAFAPSPQWALAARYVAFDEPVPTTVGSVVDGLEHVYGAVGRLEFEHAGERHALTAFPGFAPGTLTVLFSDATAGITTYGAVRSLTVDAPATGGAVVIDFNRATNLPCAYTPHATCPLPPPGNRLPFPVEAGEQTPVTA